MRHIFKAFTAFIHRLQRRSLDTRPHTETDQEVKDNLKLRIRICSSGTLVILCILFSINTCGPTGVLGEGE
ncbi:hypothetical protein ACFX13_046959 [Malus domestica]